jgi:hypothetical protein
MKVYNPWQYHLLTCYVSPHDDPFISKHIGDIREVEEINKSAVIVASQTQSFTFDNNTFVPFSK